MSRSSGFTIIELLVVLFIMTTLLGTGIAGFREFNRRQKTVTVRGEIVSALRFAQSEASSGNRAGCLGDFEGYSFNINSSQYTIQVSCSGGNITVRTEAVDEGVDINISGTMPVTFLPLAGGTDLASGTETTILITAQGSQEAVVINSQGKIK
jgi:prepilin-type N-terminal cleavage/methylation domain-containing protein